MSRVLVAAVALVSGSLLLPGDALSQRAGMHGGGGGVRAGGFGGFRGGGVIGRPGFGGFRGNAIGVRPGFGGYGPAYGYGRSRPLLQGYYGNAWRYPYAGYFRPGPKYPSYGKAWRYPYYGYYRYGYYPWPRAYPNYGPYRRAGAYPYYGYYRWPWSYAYYGSYYPWGWAWRAPYYRAPYISYGYRY